VQLLVNSLIATDIFDREHGQFRKTRWAKAFEEDAEAVSGDTTSITSLDRKATIVIEHLIQVSRVFIDPGMPLNHSLLNNCSFLFT